MKWSLLVLGAILWTSVPEWGTDLTRAKEQAAREHKLILLNFSGSDWCGPCIRMKKEVFSSEDFTAFASERLVLVNADFPRSRKNQLPKEQQDRNDQLAETYNSKGIFPFTLLLSPEGKVLKTWEGNPNLNPGQFITQIKDIHAAGR